MERFSQKWNFLGDIGPIMSGIKQIQDFTSRNINTNSQTWW
uniref:Uncharacterized protein n=1 Tax=Anguilla anguilla TaxID=7936 RepID=A0A0E9PQF4_ANGAN